jgi:hypothetical protein
MNFQIDVSSTLPGAPAEQKPSANSSSAEVADLLRQLLEVSREQLAYQRAAAAAHDSMARWRSYLSRWSEELPGLSEQCRQAMPLLERAYGQLITELTERLAEDGALDTDFALQEVLDRFGMRLAQLGTILNLVGPLAEAGSSQE